MANRKGDLRCAIAPGHGRFAGQGSRQHPLISRPERVDLETKVAAFWITQVASFFYKARTIRNFGTGRNFT